MALDTFWVLGNDQKEVSSTLAHEYFHLIQSSYDRKKTCMDYFKIDEGTATYIKDYVYPKYNREHDWFEFFENGRTQLKEGMYGTWTFFKYLVEMHGSDIIRSIYVAMQEKGALDAIDSVILGGFKKQWPSYSVYEWNQDPLADGFFAWDDFKFVPGRGAQVKNQHMTPIPVENVYLDTNGTYRKEMDLDLKPLTRDFYAFEMKEPDVRSIAVENPGMMANSRVAVRALVRKRGQTKFDDVEWKENLRHEYQFCLDKKDEDIDLIVIVIANYRHQSDAPTFKMKPSFKATNQACHEMTGYLKTVYNSPEGDQEKLRVEASATGVVFKENGRVKNGMFRNNYSVTAGTIMYSHHGVIDDCVGTKSGVMQVKNGMNYSLTATPYNVPPEAWGQYDISIDMEDNIYTVNYACPPPKRSFTRNHFLVLSTGSEIQSHDGFATFKGTSYSNGWKSEWSFKPQKEN